jgi:hypothetical protein
MASSFDDVMAARGGLDGGDGSPEEGTSGIPLCPANAGSAVVETLQGRDRVDEVAAGKDADIAVDGLAIIITTTILLVFHWRHCYRGSSFVLKISRFARGEEGAEMVGEVAKVRSML